MLHTGTRTDSQLRACFLCPSAMRGCTGGGTTDDGQALSSGDPVPNVSFRSVNHNEDVLGGDTTEDGLPLSSGNPVPNVSSRSVNHNLQVVVYRWKLDLLLSVHIQKCYQLYIKLSVHCICIIHDMFIVDVSYAKYSDIKPRCWEPAGHYLCTPEPGRPGCVISIQNVVNAREETDKETKFSALYTPPPGFKEHFVTCLSICSSVLFYNQRYTMQCSFP